MGNIFYRGQFDNYKTSNFAKSLEAITESVDLDAGSLIKTKVFISHKHDDLDDLQGVIGFLENELNVDVYIDSMDKSMPTITSGKTANRIKNKIQVCDRFILLATNAAIESKWCNWELGFADSNKLESGCLALFPMCDDKFSESQYKGNEYMNIYPYIKYEDGHSKFDNGKYISEGYYVIGKKSSGIYYTPLEEWLET